MNGRLTVGEAFAMRLVRLILAIVIFGAAGPAVAGPLEDADAAYEKGDFAPALRLWRPLADQGHADAQYNLAFMYANGKGVPQDYTSAVSWYRKAAEQGNARAQASLGYMFSIGRGVPRDYVQAHKWFNLSAAQGNAVAAKNRDDIAAKMKPAQIAEAQKLAREWKPQPVR
jgi:TPR repeat protein